MRNLGNRAKIAQPHVAFLSSLSEGVKGLRRELHERWKGALWVAERSCPELEFEPPLKRVDACIDAITQSEIFICVLAGKGESVRRGGTPIEVSGLSSFVSYFEIEIFEAAVNGLPVVFLLHPNFNPGRQMRDFLDVLAKSTVVTRRKKCASVAEIHAEVRDAIVNREALRNAAGRKRCRSAATLAAALIANRADLNAVRAGGTDMLWLRGESIKPRSLDGSAFARSLKLLKVAQAETRHELRLSRLYFLFRELMALPYRDQTDSQILALWNAAFGLWCGSAAWYGLHNPLALGVIGGLWSQHLVREALRANNARLARAELIPPYGGLASAYLSLARLCSIRWRRRVAGAGISLANRVVEAGLEHDVGILAVRGSLFFTRGQPRLGMKDFRSLLARAKKQPENLTLLAEANTYLGRGYSFTLRPRKALPHLQEAVGAWRKHIADKKSGHEFLTKTLKHLLIAQIQLNDRDAAEITAVEAIQIARERSVRDQARQIEEVANRAGIRLPQAR